MESLDKITTAIDAIDSDLPNSEVYSKAKIKEVYNLLRELELEVIAQPTEEEVDNLTLRILELEEQIANIEEDIKEVITDLMCFNEEKNNEAIEKNCGKVSSYKILKT